MYEFTYHKPASLDEIANFLGANEEAKLVAGGMTLIPTLKLRLAKPSDLVDLASIPSLRGITDAGDAIVIGAMTRHAEVNRSPVVKQGIPALAAMAGMIGDPAVRNRGTIGGSISNNDPAADYPAALVALGATVHTTKREIPAESFFTGMFETALEPAEIVTSVRFPEDADRELSEIPEPGLALRDRRRLCRPHAKRRPRRGDRRRPARVPRPRDGGGTGDVLHPRRDQGHHDPRHRAQLRHPRIGRVPRPSRRRHGPPRRRRLRVGLTAAIASGSKERWSVISVAQLAAEQPIDGYRVDRDDRQDKHAGAPEQER